MEEDNRELTVIPAADLPAPNHFTVTATGLIVSEDASTEECLEFGKRLGQVEGAVQFCIGDLVNSERTKVFGELKRIAAVMGIDYIHVRKCSAVANNVKRVSRRTGLAFGHHVLVMTMTSSKQNSWLGKAERKKWTVSQFRHAIAFDAIEEAKQDETKRWKLVEQAAKSIAGWRKKYDGLSEFDSVFVLIDEILKSIEEKTGAA